MGDDREDNSAKMQMNRDGDDVVRLAGWSEEREGHCTWA